MSTLLLNAGLSSPSTEVYLLPLNPPTSRVVKRGAPVCHAEPGHPSTRTRVTFFYFFLCAGHEWGHWPAAPPPCRSAVKLGHQPDQCAFKDAPGTLHAW